MTTAQFWMVLDMRPGAVCSHRHETRKTAILEAERLTAKENRPFGVMELVGICRPAPKVLWDEAKPAEGEAAP